MHARLNRPPEARRSISVIVNKLASKWFLDLSNKGTNYSFTLGLTRLKPVAKCTQLIEKEIAGHGANKPLMPMINPLTNNIKKQQ